MGKTALMYDSVATEWPEDAEFIMAYRDGRITSGNLAVAREKRPHARIIPISVTGLAGTPVYDCENGDLSLTDTAVVVREEIKNSRRPTVYISAGRYNALTVELATVGVKAGEVFFLLGLWDDDATIPEGVGIIGKQYATGPESGPDSFDTSIVTMEWLEGLFPELLPKASVPTPTPAVAPTAVPASPKEEKPVGTTSEEPATPPKEIVVSGLICPKCRGDLLVTASENIQTK